MLVNKNEKQCLRILVSDSESIAGETGDRLHFFSTFRLSV
jgi:hypothetical protein